MGHACVDTSFGQNYRETEGSGRQLVLLLRAGFRLIPGAVLRWVEGVMGAVL